MSAGLYAPGLHARQIEHISKSLQSESVNQIYCKYGFANLLCYCNVSNLREQIFTWTSPLRPLSEAGLFMAPTFSLTFVPSYILSNNKNIIVASKCNDAKKCDHKKYSCDETNSARRRANRRAAVKLDSLSQR